MYTRCFVASYKDDKFPFFGRSRSLEEDLTCSRFISLLEVKKVRDKNWQKILSLLLLNRKITYINNITIGSAFVRLVVFSVLE